MTAGSSRGEHLARVLSAAPDRLPTAAAAAAGVLFLGASLGVFVPWLMVPLAAAAAAATWWLKPNPLDLRPRSWIADGLALLAAAIWVVVQIPFASESVLAWRDPGIYGLQGIWLAGNGSLAIPVHTAAEWSSNVELTAPGSPVWFYAGPAELHLQGGAGLPAIVGAGTWAGGIGGALAANLVVAGIALLALYAVARRVVGRGWGLVPPVVLGISMPFAAFSRAPYSELLVLALFLIGLVWLISADVTGRAPDFAVAGALIGATGFARIDSAIIVIGVVASTAIAALCREGEARDRLAAGILPLSFAALLGTALALGSLLLNTPRYLRELGLETVALVGFAILVSLAAVLITRRSVRRAWVLPRPRLATIVVVASILLFAFWASRPLWLVSRLMFKPAFQEAVESYQLLDGLPVDGRQSYEEYTLWWTAWYFGAVLLVLGVAGIVLLLRRGVLGGDLAAIVVAGTVLACGVLYFDLVRITPDQIWAFRRFVPVVLPGLLIAAAVALAALARRTWWRRVLAGIAVAAILVQTGLAFRPMFPVVEGAGQVVEAQAVCDALHDHGVRPGDVIALAGSLAPSNYDLTVRVLCDIEVVFVPADPADDPADVVTRLAALDEVAPEPLVYLTFDQPLANELAHGDASVHAAGIVTWERHLLRIPAGVLVDERAFWVGALRTS